MSEPAVAAIRPEPSLRRSLPQPIPGDAAMRAPAPPGAGVCPRCRLFIDPARALCHACASQPNHLDAMVPISYAPRGGSLYSLLRRYKNARFLTEGTFAVVRVSSILWHFLEHHEISIAAAAHADRFDFVTTVPSGSPDRDELRANLRAIAASCGPISERYRRLLRPAGRGRWGRAFDPTRYEAIEARYIRGRAILLIDDLWVTGGHAQSAAHALRQAGATTVALLVVGRYLRLDWPAGPSTTCADRLASLDRPFDLSNCAAHTP